MDVSMPLLPVLKSSTQLENALLREVYENYHRKL